MADQAQQEYAALLASINKGAFMLNKHDTIRLRHWLEKLAAPLTNTIWRQNRNLYMKILQQMVTQGELLKPFNVSPPQGPLPKITIYDVPYPIRVKLSNDQNCRQRNTQSINKTSKCLSRKNSSGKCEIARKSQSKQKKEMEHKKKIVFDHHSSSYQGSDDKQNMLQNYHLYNNKCKVRNNSMYEDKENQKPKNSTVKINFNTHNYNSIKSQKVAPKSVSKGLRILKNSLKLLGKHYDQFEDNVAYSKLIQKIVETGQSFGENFIETSISNTQQSIEVVESYNQRIKHKLFETDLNSLEFMTYLNSLV